MDQFYIFYLINLLAIFLKNEKSFQPLDSFQNLLKDLGFEGKQLAFQKKLQKNYDVRVTCFGDYLVAAKLMYSGIVDVRLEIEPYTLPDDLTKKIQLLMHNIGLVFATFDFIVTEDGEYIFIDVNEQGQFLWLETFNPEFKMLDMFIHFLLQKSNRYNWQPSGAVHDLKSYEQLWRVPLHSAI